MIKSIRNGQIQSNTEKISKTKSEPQKKESPKP